MSFKIPYFCFSATSSTSHKHDLLCSTRWLENTNIPSGIYLFLWIIPILFTLISSLLWWINYWHFWCSIFLLICSSFFPFPQLTTKFHYYLCVLSFTLILQLLNAPVMLTFLKHTIDQYSYITPNAAVVTYLVNCLLPLPQSLPI